MSLLSKKEIEKEFPATKKLCYLNTASTGLIPQRSIKEMKLFMRRYSGEKLGHDRESFGMLERLRELLGKILGCKPTRIALTFNTSHGINAAANGLPIKRGGKIVLPPNEFPANFYPWEAQKRRGAELMIAKKPTENALDIPDTKIIALSWVRYFDGLRFDLEKCANIANKRGAYLCVDGIQGAGALEPDLQNSGVHIFSAGGQKWLLSPYGTGVLYVREGTPLKPIYVNWLSRFLKTAEFFSLQKYDIPTPNDATAFEFGSLSYHNLWAMYRSIELFCDIGIARIENHTTGLAKDFANGAKSIGLKVAAGTRKLSSSIVSLKAKNPSDIHNLLLRNNIICSHREGLLRFSFHIYNTSGDVMRTLTILDKAGVR